MSVLVKNGISVFCPCWKNGIAFVWSVALVLWRPVAGLVVVLWLAVGLWLAVMLWLAVAGAFAGWLAEGLWLAPGLWVAGWLWGSGWLAGWLARLWDWGDAVSLGFGGVKG